MKKGVLFSIFIFIMYSFAYASPPKYWNHFKEAGKIYNIDPKILAAIAMHESKLNKYAINSKNRNKSIDVGVMQINSCHFKVLKSKLKDLNKLYNPRININIGGWVLKGCIDKYDVTWKAIDCYNKGFKRARGSSKYIKEVYKEYRKIKYKKWN